jgi:cell wall-associated NlpC family hydrolase
MKPFDPRVNAVRADLADVALEGKVEALRFVPGEPMRVAAASAPVRRAPSSTAPLDTEALRGERVTVFETNADGWCWVQLADDRYVGWMPRDALGAPGTDPTHKVSALRTFVFSEPDIKSAPLQALSLGARVTVIGEAEDKNARYALVEPHGAVVMQHLAPMESLEPDWPAIAGKFLGVPYLWGGKTSLGLDCSGLTQLSLAACGIRVPRDSDMQAELVGQPLPSQDGVPAVTRGDLIFWPGHVGIMRDENVMIHASAHVMAVLTEPLSEAIERLARKGVKLAAIRRPVTDSGFTLKPERL